MRLFSTTPNKHYFISIFIIGAVLLATFSTVLYRQYNQSLRVTNWTVHNYEVLRLSRNILISLLNIETGARGYLLTGRDDFLDPYNEGLRTLPERLDTLRSEVRNDEAMQRDVNGWLNKIDALKHMLATNIANYRNGSMHAVSPTILQVEKENMDGLRETMDKFIESHIGEIQAQSEQSKIAQDNFLYILIIGTGLAIGGMLVGTLIILTLVSRNRAAEDQVRAGEERLLAIMNGINDGLFDLNLVTHTVYYSPSYKAMLGYRDEEYPNTTDMFKQLIHPEDYDAMMNHARQYRNREIPVYAHIFRMMHKDGNWRWILARGAGFWNSKGEMTRLVGTHTDITEHKAREEELQQLNKDLESFTYIASHDLRSPLVNLKGFAKEMELALERAKPVIERAKPGLLQDERDTLEESLEKDIPEALGFINTAVDKMDKLTTAVLDLSRIGKHEYRYETVDTSTLVRRCLDAQAYEIQTKDIEVICESLPVISSDALALEQIFSNLIDNAVKYLKPDRRGKIIISGHCTERDCVFSISDNGRGIDPADQKRVFDIFRRARNAGNVRGLGMGMTFVKATLRKLHGSIWFESALDSGTTFYFKLPKHV